MFIYLGFDYEYYYDDVEETGRERVAVALECPYCSHTWEPKVPNPLACPKCKRYFTDDKLAGEIDNYSPQSRIRKPVEAKVPKTNNPNPKAYVQCYRGARFGTCGERAVIKLGKHSYCYEHAVDKLKELEAEMRVE